MLAFYMLSIFTYLSQIKVAILGSYMAESVREIRFVHHSARNISPPSYLLRMIN